MQLEKEHDEKSARKRLKVAKFAECSHASNTISPARKRRITAITRVRPTVYLHKALVMPFYLSVKSLIVLTHTFTLWKLDN